jgi:hypothetical protein
MSDGVESRQGNFDSEMHDVFQGIHDEMILLWKYRPQVQQNSTFFHTRNHRGIRRAQALG